MSSSSSSSSSLSELESLRQRVAELEARLHSIERNAEQKKRTTIETISGEVVDSNPYSRLMALKAMGIVKDYSRIRDVSVLIVGVGGVGSVAAEMLTRCGVGKLILFDYDKVELANMNRLFFRPEHCGLMKVDAARLTLREINPDVKIDTYHYNITSVDHFDHFLTTIKTGGIKEGTPITLLLCCVDNYEARISINSAMNELDQVWMESGVSEDAVAGHIQLCLPGRSACFECTPPLIVATGGNERSLKREGVCAASLPTTMGLVAALLVQNVLKYTLEFGELTYYLGYNSLKDYFPTWPMNPNPHCNNNHCRKLQQKYKGWKTREELEAERLAAEKANQQEESFDNEWGITIDESSEDKDNEKLTKAGLSTEFTAATNTTIAAEDIAPSADGEDLNDLLAQLKSAQLGK